MVLGTRLHVKLLLSGCFKVFIFHRFHYNLSPCRAFPRYTTWSLLSFLHIRFMSFFRYSDIISPNILPVLASLSFTLGILLLHVSVLMVYDWSLRLCSFFIFFSLLRPHQPNQPRFTFSESSFCLFCSWVPLVKRTFLWHCSTSEFVYDSLFIIPISLLISCIWWELSVSFSSLSMVSFSSLSILNMVKLFIKSIVCASSRVVSVHFFPMNGWHFVSLNSSLYIAPFYLNWPFWILWQLWKLNSPLSRASFCCLLWAVVL